MNLTQINEFRAAHGLAPVTPENPQLAAQRKRAAAANKAARAQACRDLKANRSKGKK